MRGAPWLWLTVCAAAACANARGTGEPIDAAIDGPAGDAAGADAATVDAAVPDAPTGDAAGTDAAATDAAAIDAAPLDAALIDAAPIDAPIDAAGPLQPSTYTYRRVAVGGLREAQAVAFHPDGSYAVVLERTDGVHVYDWATDTAVRYDVRVAGRSITLDAIAFAPGGGHAYIVGWERVGTVDTGVVIDLDDAALHAGAGAAAFTRLAATASGERFTGIAFPHTPAAGPAGDGRPVVVSQSGSSPYIARLRELQLTTGGFAGLFVATSTSAGCDDVAFVDNELGGWGLALACGTNGATAPYYTSIAGIGEWRLPTSNLGNISRLAARPGGAYALIVNWSSSYLHRFEAGALRPTSTSPSVAPSIYDVSFAPTGDLALITGRALGATLRGTVYEYRHDLWTTAAITDVSIPGFAAAPYLGTSNTYLYDSAFRPGCAGGLLVGGEATPTSRGLLIEFQRTAGTPCR